MKAQDIFRKIEKLVCHGAYIIVDSNELLELFLGKKGEGNLRRILKRRNFRIVITPQVLAEFFNLKQRYQVDDRAYSLAVTKLIECLEFYIPKNKMLRKTEIKKFGITDISLIETLSSDEYKNKAFLISTDNKLVSFCQKLGLPAVEPAIFESIQFPRTF